MAEKPIPEQLKEARIAADLTQDEAASLLDVTGKTISRWETGHPVKAKDVAAALRAYHDHRHGTGRPDKKVPRGTNGSRPLMVSESRGAYEVLPPDSLRTRRVLRWLASFVARLEEAKVPDDQIEEAIALVTHPSTLTRYKGGKPIDLLEGEAIEEMEALAEVVYKRQRDLGRKFK